jgi:hypothetical protein
LILFGIQEGIFNFSLPALHGSCAGLPDKKKQPVNRIAVKRGKNNEKNIT